MGGDLTVHQVSGSSTLCCVCCVSPGMGDKEPGRPADDLVFVVSEKPHSRFKRDGNDLQTTVTLPLMAALTGGSTQVTR